MDTMLIYRAGTTRACAFAAAALWSAGVPITDHPQPEITHLLLDAPSLDSAGNLRGGGSLSGLLEQLPAKVRVIGGNLDHPALEDYPKIDLLRDEMYLSENAAITADCALKVAREAMSTTFRDAPALVLGWGRIGKCLARDLKALGCPVTVAARKEKDRAMLGALGYDTLDTAHLEGLPGFRLVFNTAPEPVIHKDQRELCKNGILIDLASKPGIEGENVIWARGLPGVHAPESSGRLIARRFLALCGEGKL